MKPYYEQGGITIYHGDCREILPTLPKVDLVLTDPPYANLIGGYDRKGSILGKCRQPSRAIADPWNANFEWVPLLRATGAFVFCSHHNLPETAIAFSSWRRAVLITWHKRNAAPTGKNVPRFTEEHIWGFAAHPGLQWDFFKSTLLDVPNLPTGCLASKERVLNPDGTAAHPTQKPESICRALLGVGGDVILDPFMGSGTTLRAAKDMGRRAIGIEIEEKYCEIAVRRMAQGVLF